MRLFHDDDDDCDYSDVDGGVDDDIDNDCDNSDGGDDADDDDGYEDNGSLSYHI